MKENAEEARAWHPDDTYLLAIVGHAMYRATLGNVNPMTAQVRERMLNPRPGDLVLEISRLGGMRADRFDPDSIGRLIRVEGDVREGTDRWVVEPLGKPGAEQGWRNVTFVAIPDRHRWIEEG